mgnify:CR=1 FL=1
MNTEMIHEINAIVSKIVEEFGLTPDSATFLALRKAVIMGMNKG